MGLSVGLSACLSVSKTALTVCMSVSQRLVNGVFYDLQNGLKCMKRDKYKPGTGWHFTAMKTQNAGKLKLWGDYTCMGIFHARLLGLVCYRKIW